MTSTRGEQEFAQVWLAFVQAIRQLLEMIYVQPDREHLEPYRGWSGEVLGAVSRDQFVGELDERWSRLQGESPETAYLLLQELRLYPPAVTAIGGKFWRRANKREAKEVREGMSIGKTALDSLLDLLDDLPMLIKGPLKVLGEMLDIMKGPGGE